MIGKVRVYKFVEVISPNPCGYGKNVSSWVRVFQYEGILHQFAQDFEELRDGIGTVPVGIVELPNGDIESVGLRLLELIK